MAFRHVLQETAASKPCLSPRGHLGEAGPRHAVGDIDASPLTALRADGLAYLSHLHPAPIANLL